MSSVRWRDRRFRRPDREDAIEIDNSNLTKEEITGQYAYFLELVAEGIQKRVLKDVAPELLFHLSYYQTLAVVSYIIEHPELQNDADFYELGFDLYWDSIKRI